MPFIILSDKQQTPVMERASRFLQKRGCRVCIETDRKQLQILLESGKPDVWVVGTEIQLFTQEVINFHSEASNYELPQIVWIPAFNSDMEPAFGWAGAELSSYVAYPSNPWQVVMAVEQLIYRQVLPLKELLAGDVLTFWTEALREYLQEHRGIFPDMTSPKTMHKALSEGSQGAWEQMKHPDPPRQFCTNSSLTHLNVYSLLAKSEVLAFYEDSLTIGGWRWVALICKNEGALGFRLEKIDSSAWKNISMQIGL